MYGSIGKYPCIGSEFTDQSDKTGKYFWQQWDECQRQNHRSLYFTDVGLRNAQLNFRQQEENHIMENIIYNELLIRGFNVDVGVVEHSERDENGKVVRKRLEVDFVCNRGNQRYYIQSAFAIPDSSKMQQEQNSLVHIGDSFKKIIVVKDRIKLWRNVEGIVVMGIMDFLLNPNSLEL